MAGGLEAWLGGLYRLRGATRATPRPTRVLTTSTSKSCRLAGLAAATLPAPRAQQFALAAPRLRAARGRETTTATTAANRSLAASSARPSRPPRAVPCLGWPFRGQCARALMDGERRARGRRRGARRPTPCCLRASKAGHRRAEAPPMPTPPLACAALIRVLHAVPCLARVLHARCSVDAPPCSVSYDGAAGRTQPAALACLRRVACSWRRRPRPRRRRAGADCLLRRFASLARRHQPWILCPSLPAHSRVWRKRRCGDWDGRARCRAPTWSQPSIDAVIPALASLVRQQCGGPASLEYTITALVSNVAPALGNAWSLQSRRPPGSLRLCLCLSFPEVRFVPLLANFLRPVHRNLPFAL
jgi:hypothetical protein